MSIKLFLLLTISIIFACGCSLSLPKKLTAEERRTQLNQIVAAIQSKPDWLQPAEICATEIFPVKEKEIEYLFEGCENSPQHCLEKCRREDGNACYSLALLIQRDVSEESKEVAPLFLRSCKFGIISGCTNYAAGESNYDSPDEKTLKCSADTFEKSCAMNDSWGCSMYGTALAFGQGREQNFGEALKYLNKTCDRFGERTAACQGAKTVKKQIEDFRNKNQSNDSNTNTEKRAGKNP